MLGKFTSFLRESKQEFKKINWPTRPETTKMVFVVVLLSLFVAAFLGTWDYLFLRGLEVVTPQSVPVVNVGGEMPVLPGDNPTGVTAPETEAETTQ